MIIPMTARPQKEQWLRSYAAARMKLNMKDSLQYNPFLARVKLRRHYHPK